MTSTKTTLPTPAGDPPLTVRGVRKAYGETEALRGVDVVVEPGTVAGLLGRNGAGKSTFVQLIAGLDQPDAGEIRIFGAAPGEAVMKGALGYCSQEVALYPTRTVRQNLEFFARLSARHESARHSIPRLLDDLGLSHLGDRRVRFLSGGERRRVHLAVALLGQPALLVLDEVTAGVDVESRDLIANVVRTLADHGAAVLYTSHDLVEVENLCSEVVILHHGEVLASGTTPELAEHLGQLIRLEFEDQEMRDAATRIFETFRPRTRGRTRLELLPGDAAIDAACISTECTAHGWSIRRLEVVAAGLENVFLTLTGGDDETSG